MSETQFYIVVISVAAIGVIVAAILIYLYLFRRRRFSRYHSEEHGHVAFGTDKYSSTLEDLNAEITKIRTREVAGYGPWQDVVDDRIVNMLFATTRTLSDEEGIWFTGERADHMTQGWISVRVPEAHRLGEVEHPFQLSIAGITLYSAKLRSDQHFAITQVGLLSEDQWRRNIAASAASTAFVFVHGFNTNFRDAADRCAQLTWDLKLDALPILFTWPSRSRVVDYLYDQNSASLAKNAFIECLRAIKSQPNIERIHILAHSMGNQVVLEALAKHDNEEAPLGISELMMAAPDVDVDIYAELAGKVRTLTTGMTLYATSADKALKLSKAIAGDVSRAGDVSKDGPVLVAGVDAIDVTALGTEILGLNHGLFAQKRSILNDIDQLIRLGQRPPDTRLADIRGVPDDGSNPRYWRYVP